MEEGWNENPVVCRRGDGSDVCPALNSMVETVGMLLCLSVSGECIQVGWPFHSDNGWEGIGLVWLLMLRCVPAAQAWSVVTVTFFPGIVPGLPMSTMLNLLSYRPSGFPPTMVLFLSSYYLSGHSLPSF